MAHSASSINIHETLEDMKKAYQEIAAHHREDGTDEVDYWNTHSARIGRICDVLSEMINYRITMNSAQEKYVKNLILGFAENEDYAIHHPIAAPALLLPLATYINSCAASA